MTVRAKFWVSAVEPQTANVHIGNDEHGNWVWGEQEVYTVTLYPVTGGSPENEKFYASTPGGEIKLGVINAGAVAQFEPGKTYYVDFTPAS